MTIRKHPYFNPYAPIDNPVFGYPHIKYLPEPDVLSPKELYDKYPPEYPIADPFFVKNHKHDKYERGRLFRSFAAFPAPFPFVQSNQNPMAVPQMPFAQGFPQPQIPQIPDPSMMDGDPSMMDPSMVNPMMQAPSAANMEPNFVSPEMLQEIVQDVEQTLEEEGLLGQGGQTDISGGGGTIDFGGGGGGVDQGGFGGGGFGGHHGFGGGGDGGGGDGGGQDQGDSSGGDSGDGGGGFGGGGFGGHHGGFGGGSDSGGDFGGGGDSSGGDSGGDFGGSGGDFGGGGQDQGDSGDGGGGGQGGHHGHGGGDSSHHSGGGAKISHSKSKPSGHHSSGGSSGHHSGGSGHRGGGGSGGGGHHGRGGGHRHEGGHHSSHSDFGIEYPMQTNPFMQDPYAIPHHGRMSLHPYSPNSIYEAGEKVSVAGSGFIPGEMVTVQLYTVSNSGMGTAVNKSHLRQRIGNAVTTTDSHGHSNPKNIHLPNFYGKDLAVALIGHSSGKKIIKTITVV